VIGVAACIVEGWPNQNSPRSTTECASSRKCQRSHISRSCGDRSGKHRARLVRTMCARDRINRDASQPSTPAQRWRVCSELRPRYEKKERSKGSLLNFINVHPLGAGALLLEPYSGCSSRGTAGGNA